MAEDRPDGDSDFFEKNYERVYRYVRGMVRDPNEAEDQTQEAFLRAHRERETLRDPGAMLSWLYRIATHVALDRLRQRRTQDSRRVFVAMVLMLASWPGMALSDPSRATLSGLAQLSGYGVAAAGLVLAVGGGLLQLGGLENVDHLETTGLYSKLRHPTHSGFILWVAGWALVSGALMSFALGVLRVANILYWRSLEEGALRARYGDGYRVYCQGTWF